MIVNSGVIHSHVVSRLMSWVDRHSILLTRPLIVVAVIAGSAILAPKASLVQIVAILAPAGALFLLRNPLWGIAGLVVASLVVPVALGTGSQTELNVTVLLLPALIGLWVFDMVLQRRIRLLRSRTILPLVGLVLAAIVSFINGQLPWFPIPPAPVRAQLGGVTIFALSAGAFLLIAHQVRDVLWLERFTWLYIGVGGLYIVSQLHPILGQIIRLPFQRGATDGSLFWTWLVALTFSQAIFNRKLRPAWRIALMFLIVCTLYVSIVQRRDWLSGWLPSLVAIATILWIGSPRLGLAATLVGAVGTFAKLQSVASSVANPDNQYSWMTRLAAWNTLWDIIKINPILGLGPSNYYWYTPMFNIMGYYVSFNSHNNYVDLIAQVGVVGLILFLWFAWELSQVGWNLCRQALTGFPRAYAIGALGGLAGTLAAAMLGDWVLPFVYNVGLAGMRASVPAWLFMGGLIALEQIITRPSSESKT